MPSLTCRTKPVRFACAAKLYARHFQTFLAVLHLGCSILETGDSWREREDRRRVEGNPMTLVNRTGRVSSNVSRSIFHTSETERRKIGLGSRETDTTSK